MKFSQVPIGEMFNYQGNDYTKSGPLTATTESDGKSKLIPRSANVKLLKSESVTEADKDDKLIPTSELVKAVSEYHEQSLDFIATFKNEISNETIADIQIQLNNYYQSLLAKLSRT